MKKSALIAALVLVLPALAAPRAQAQATPTNATTNGQLATSNTANALGLATTPTVNGQLTGPRGGTTTGVICIEEMTATFCNVVIGPNTNGYGSSGGSAAAGAGAGSASAAGSAAGGGGSGATSSIPACSSFPPPNELCN